MSRQLTQRRRLMALAQSLLIGGSMLACFWEGGAILLCSLLNVDLGYYTSKQNLNTSYHVKRYESRRPMQSAVSFINLGQTYQKL